jgi:hypothetical protein
MGYGGFKYKTFPVLTSARQVLRGLILYLLASFARRAGLILLTEWL